jgi:hypothetical protein
MNERSNLIFRPIYIKEKVLKLARQPVKNNPNSL